MKNLRLVSAIRVVTILLITVDSVAQTCSCAGVPLLGSMELVTPGEGKWFVASTYEFHDSSKLVSGSSGVPNSTGRDRTSNILMLETSRRLFGKLSFSAMISAVKHDRKVGGAHDSASGMGDAIVMLKYSPVTISAFSRNAFSLGVGARLPLGEDNATSDGIVLAEDMQPSTGAFGSILWVYAAHALNEPATARLYATASYTNNGENDRNYQFGHETRASLGIGYKTQSPWGFNVELLYVQTKRDKRASTSIPNTGGEWLNIIPSVQYNLNESMALALSAKIPVSRNLNDQLQFTTKYAVRLTFSHIFGS